MIIPWRILFATMIILATVVKCHWRKKDKNKENYGHNNNRKSNNAEGEGEASGPFVFYGNSEATEKPITSPEPKTEKSNFDGGNAKGEYTYNFGASGKSGPSTTTAGKEKVGNVQPQDKTQHMSGSAKAGGSFQQSGRTMEGQAQQKQPEPIEEPPPTPSDIEETDSNIPQNEESESPEYEASLENSNEPDTNTSLATEDERKSEGSPEVKNGENVAKGSDGAESKVMIKFGGHIKRKESADKGEDAKAQDKDMYSYNGAMSSNSSISIRDSKQTEAEKDSLAITEATDNGAVGGSGSGTVKISFGPKIGKKKEDAQILAQPVSTEKSAPDKDKISYESHVKMEAGQGTSSNQTPGGKNGNDGNGSGNRNGHSGGSNSVGGTKADRRQQRQNENNKKKWKKNHQNQSGNFDTNNNVQYGTQNQRQRKNYQQQHQQQQDQQQQNQQQQNQRQPNQQQQNEQQQNQQQQNQQQQTQQNYQQPNQQQQTQQNYQQPNQQQQTQQNYQQPNQQQQTQQNYPQQNPQSYQQQNPQNYQQQNQQQRNQYQQQQGRKKQNNGLLGLGIG